MIETLDNWIKLNPSMSCKIRHKGRRSHVAVERAMYSLSVVDSAIPLCNLLA
jgi:hypothetical protein